MSQLLLSKGQFPKRLLQPTVDYILANQHSSGAIAWFPDGHTDPWDHVEAAMGLSIGGAWDAAAAAYDWLRATQRKDGGWYVSYRDGTVDDASRSETNFVAYVATGIWHHYLISAERRFLEHMWPTLQAAVDFVLRLQAPTGEVYWALDHHKGVDEDALVTGCSSIYKSLECAINAAHVLGLDPAQWVLARARLGDALRQRPDRFDRTWESKHRFSMDWFYPVLTGVLDPGASGQRLDARWEEFVVPGLGCRCVSDHPWVTIAESCELTLALIAAGRGRTAAELFSWLHEYRLEDGSYWTGYVFADEAIWPEERPTWTAGAILLAADALTGTTAASRLFTSVKLPETAQQAERLHQRQLLK